jgi:hypothetical protein
LGQKIKSRGEKGSKKLIKIPNAYRKEFRFHSTFFFGTYGTTLWTTSVINAANVMEEKEVRQ